MSAALSRPARPRAPIWNQLPRPVRGLPQWVGWRWAWSEQRQCWAKVPVTAEGRPASSTDPATWTTFEAIYHSYDALRLDGVGIVMRRQTLIDGLPLAGFDFDHCLDELGRIVDPIVASYVRGLNTYCEISPRGSGLRLLALGGLPPQDRKLGNLEVYDHGRYLTLTGNRLAGTPATINERRTEVTTVHGCIFRGRIDRRQAAQAPRTYQYVPAADDLDLLERARQARNGAKFAQLYDHGDWQGAGFPSQSEADLWLTARLLFWAGGEVARAVTLFKASALMRPKFDRPDYRERTLETAVRA